MKTRIEKEKVPRINGYYFDLCEPMHESFSSCVVWWSMSWPDDGEHYNTSSHTWQYMNSLIVLVFWMELYFPYIPWPSLYREIYHCRRGLHSIYCHLTCDDEVQILDFGWLVRVSAWQSGMAQFRIIFHLIFQRQDIFHTLLSTSRIQLEHFSRLKTHIPSLHDNWMLGLCWRMSSLWTE